jgi:hypothetical protein
MPGCVIRYNFISNQKNFAALMFLNPTSYDNPLLFITFENCPL